MLNNLHCFYSMPDDCFRDAEDVLEYLRELPFVNEPFLADIFGYLWKLNYSDPNYIYATAEPKKVYSGRLIFKFTQSHFAHVLYHSSSIE